jgi:hypothetical protein
MAGAEQVRQRALDPGRRHVIAGGAHEHMHATIRVLEIARQQFHADEACRARQQHAIRSGFLLGQA